MSGGVFLRKGKGIGKKTMHQKKQRKSCVKEELFILGRSMVKLAEKDPQLGNTNSHPRRSDKKYGAHKA